MVQVGAHRDQDRARTRLSQMREYYGAFISKLPSGTASADRDEDGTIHRAWLGGYASRDPADALCEQLKSAGAECFVRTR